jgi:protein-S-isoprenylcysteine O-methyltransferase Ste14
MMTATMGAAPTRDNPDVRKAVIRRMIQVFGQMAFIGALLFISAGRLDWTWAWVYLGLAVTVVVVFGIFFLPGHTDMVAERAEVKAGTKRWDRVVSLLLLVVALAMYVVAGLDIRFGWTGELSPAVHIIAAVVMVLGFVVLYWAMLTNRFFATSVRIQTERDHSVVDSGPYRFVRHPGYVGILIHTLASLVLLGSLWALALGALDVILYVIRTSLEDKTLQAELPGYKEYATRTRYRLIPGIY